MLEDDFVLKDDLIVIDTGFLVLEDTHVLVWVDFLLIVDVLRKLVDIISLVDETAFRRTHSQRVSDTLAV